MKIYKYKIENNGATIPADAKILTCQMQDHCLHVWALVDPETHVTAHYDFMIVGTGHDFEPKDWEYLSTIQDGPFVWHIWMRKNDWEFS
jgi:hypothetical protein